MYLTFSAIAFVLAFVKIVDTSEISDLEERLKQLEQSLLIQDQKHRSELKEALNVQERKNAAETQKLRQELYQIKHLCGSPGSLCVSLFLLLFFLLCFRDF